MIRNFRFASVSSPLLALLLALALPASAAPAQAPATAPAKSKVTSAKPAPAVKIAAAAPAVTSKTPAAKATPAATTTGKAATSPAAAGKPVLVASYGDWGAYAAQTGKSKTCYALAQPKDRVPASLKRDPGYVFISTRPAEGVHNEISFVMGFAVKADPSSNPQVKVGNATIAMVAEGTNLWVKNAAQEGQLLDAMKKSPRLTVSAPSAKGNVTTDTYSLTGIVQALDRVQKECL